jgi:ribosomal protein S18 acetylase RimI-like enzyme
MTIQVIPTHKTTYAVVPFDRDHLPPAKALAQLHRQMLPRSPISLLGQQFAQKVYYGLLPKQALIVGAVAYVNAQPIGFIAATTRPQDFMQIALRRHLVYIGTVIAIPTLIHPFKRIRAIWQALTIMQHLPASTISEDEAELLSLGVVPEYRYTALGKQIGHHVARDLLQVVVDQLASRDQMTIRAIVDQDNIAAQVFYQRSGWQVRQNSVPGWQVPSMELVLSIAPTVPK